MAAKKQVHNPSFNDLLSTLFQAHPWHGVSPGPDVPRLVDAYIEIVPTDVVKSELDKPSGLLRIDRPQRFSSMCPTLYGYIPQTYCGPEIAALCADRAKLNPKKIQGDGDPLDICVLTERDLAHGNVLVRARPIGGLRMIDKGQADDKIIAVLDQDVSYGDDNEITDIKPGLITRLKHYFLSYKQLPGERGKKTVVIQAVYGRVEAMNVIRASMRDYKNKFGTHEQRLEMLRAMLTEQMAMACRAPEDKPTSASTRRPRSR